MSGHFLLIILYVENTWYFWACLMNFMLYFAFKIKLKPFFVASLSKFLLDPYLLPYALCRQVRVDTNCNKCLYICKMIKKKRNKYLNIFRKYQCSIFELTPLTFCLIANIMDFDRWKIQNYFKNSTKDTIYNEEGKTSLVRLFLKISIKIKSYIWTEIWNEDE